ncbi:hypothetical protein NDU88_005466 [Pleurodeles waltl]|uniref:Uncharacterized protein n=1 Tax=Pleurodeles waltl TaxID=8319 RepID=A0AAV7LL80_PLEWA|nr:hypothetical protein NDU88_005466 [Pleurodeles waltl]
MRRSDFSACSPLVEGRGARLVADPRARGGDHQESSPATPPPLRPTPRQQRGGLSNGRGGSPKRCRAQRRIYCPPAKGSPCRRTPTSPSGLRDRAPGLATSQDGGRSSRVGVVVRQPPFLAAQAPQ